MSLFDRGKINGLRFSATGRARPQRGKIIVAPNPTKSGIRNGPSRPGRIRKIAFKMLSNMKYLGQKRVMSMGMPYPGRGGAKGIDSARRPWPALGQQGLSGAK